LLLEHGADVHANYDYALKWASHYGHTEIVKLLLEYGADVHVGNDYALRLASEKGHTEVVKLLKNAMKEQY
jgi:ankyrin repeat protein